MSQQTDDAPAAVDLDELLRQVAELGPKLDAIDEKIDRAVELLAAFDELAVELRPLLDRYTKNPAARFGRRAPKGQ